MIQSFYIDISCCCVRDYMVVCYICNMFLSPQNTLTSRHIIEDFSTVNNREKDCTEVLFERRCQSVFSLLINHFVKQRSHVTLYLCISYWNLILLVKVKLIKFIVVEQPPLTSCTCTSQSRITFIGTVVGCLILVVIGLLFGILIIRCRRNGNGKNTLVAGNGYGGSWCSGLGDGLSIMKQLIGGDVRSIST